MDSPLVPIVLGVFICIIGIANMRGNISSLHWYHRSRVAEEDIPVFGKLIGIGTFIIGAAIILFGAFSYISVQTQQDIYTVIGSVITVAAVVIGLGMNFYAMIKYNKGIF